MSARRLDHCKLATVSVLKRLGVIGPKVYHGLMLVAVLKTRTELVTLVNCRVDTQHERDSLAKWLIVDKEQ